jgi:hypothetical protein
MTESIVTKIKTILASLAGVLLLLLQIINLLLSTDLENAVNRKTQVLEQKNSEVKALVQQNTAVTNDSNATIKDIDKKTSTLDPAERAEILRQINARLDAIDTAEQAIRSEVDKASKK